MNDKEKMINDITSYILDYYYKIMVDYLYDKGGIYATVDNELNVIKYDKSKKILFSASANGLYTSITLSLEEDENKGFVLNATIEDFTTFYTMTLTNEVLKFKDGVELIYEKLDKIIKKQSECVPKLNENDVNLSFTNYYNYSGCSKSYLHSDNDDLDNDGEVNYLNHNDDDDDEINYLNHKGD